jgi:hypothetical protein
VASDAIENLSNAAKTKIATNIKVGPNCAAIIWERFSFQSDSNFFSSI